MGSDRYHEAQQELPEQLARWKAIAIEAKPKAEAWDDLWTSVMQADEEDFTTITTYRIKRIAFDKGLIKKSPDKREEVPENGN